jgi:Glycosyl transferases group 1
MSPSNSEAAARARTGRVDFAALIVTIAARADSASIAAVTFHEHHPQVQLRVVIVDDRFGVASDVQSDVRNEFAHWHPLRADDMAVSEAELASLAMALTPEELAVAATPMLVLELISSTHPVVLIPDDCEVVGPLDVLIDHAERGGVAVVRRRDSPLPHDGRLPDHADLVRRGRFRQDVAAFAGTGGMQALDWWAARVRLDPLLDVARLNPWRYPWFDELAVELSHLVTVCPARIARSFENIDEQPELDGASLLIFDGFDPTRPWQLSAAAGDWPRVLISDHHDLGARVTKRAAMLGQPPVRSSLEDGFSWLPNGHAIDDAMRAVYRDALIFARRHSTEPPPNPLNAEEFLAFRDWLMSPDPTRPQFTRHLAGLAMVRPDLETTFGGDPGAFALWARRNAVDEGIWSPLRDEPLVRPTRLGDSGAIVDQRTLETSGLNVVGLLSAQLGNGEHGRLFLDTLERTHIPFSIVDSDATVSKRDPSLLSGHAARGFLYDVDLLLLNADLVESALATFDRPGHPGRATAAFWAWETTVFPERYRPALQRVTEVWGVSEFVADAIRPLAEHVGVSVHAMPAPMPIVRVRTDRSIVSPVAARLGIPISRHVVYFSFDYFSVAERKLPWASVDAFRRAFPTESMASDAPMLVIKSLNHEFFPLERERLLYAARGRQDIVLIERYVSAEERDALVMRADIYLSLHRSEGFGLTLAEAMALGTPVIATGWSGNMSFMTPQNSFVVDYELVDVDRSVRVYGGLGEWAEPSIDHAASCIGDAIERRNHSLQLATQAQADLTRRRESGVDSAFVLDRLRALRRTHAQAVDGVAVHLPPRSL